MSFKFPNTDKYLPETWSLFRGEHATYLQISTQLYDRDPTVSVITVAEQRHPIDVYDTPDAEVHSMDPDVIATIELKCIDAVTQEELDALAVKQHHESEVLIAVSPWIQ